MLPPHQLAYVISYDTYQGYTEQAQYQFVEERDAICHTVVLNELNKKPVCDPN